MANDHWYVYIVRCRDDSLYTGVARDLQQRLSQHNQGKRGARYTRSRRPVELVYQETAPDRSTAQRREYQIKQLSAQQKRTLIQSTASVTPA
jgi:putative endonuclease